MSPAISQELGPSPDSSLPSPSRFQGGPRLLPLEADAGDGELPVLAALRDLAPVGDPPTLAGQRALQTPCHRTGTGARGASLQRGVAEGEQPLFY